MTSLFALEPIRKNLNFFDFFKGISLSDIEGCVWNCLLIFPPFFAGAGAALAVNRVCHRFLPRQSPPILSLSIRAAAFIIGCNFSYYVAKKMDIVPFSADHVLKLARFSLIAPGAGLGYYGTRALCVIGSGGALIGALVGPGFQKSRRQKLQDDLGTLGQAFYNLGPKHF